MTGLQDIGVVRQVSSHWTAAWASRPPQYYLPLHLLEPHVPVRTQRQ